MASSLCLIGAPLLAGALALQTTPASPTQEWLTAVHAAQGTAKKRALLGYRGSPTVPERDGPRLVQALSDPDPDVRAAAALALGDLDWESPASIRGLILLLADKDERCRLFATAALLKSSDTVVQPLLAMLRDPDVVFGRGAVAVEWTSGIFEKRSFRFPLFIGAYVLSTRPSSAPALVRLAGARPPKAPGRATDDRGEGDAAYALMALRRLGPAATDAVITGLRRQDLDRRQLLRFFSRRGYRDDRASDSAALRELLNTPELAADVRRFLDSEDASADDVLTAAPPTRARAPQKQNVQAELRKLGEKEEFDEADLLRLVTVLSDDDYQVRQAAADALKEAHIGRLGALSRDGGAAIFAALRKQLSAGRFDEVFAVLKALGPAAEPFSADLRQWIREHSRHSQAPTAIEALVTTVPTDQSLRTLEELAQEADGDVVLLAARTLAQMNGLSPQILDRVAEVAATEVSPSSIAFLMEAGAPGLARVRRIARIGSSYGRYAALVALGSTKAPEDVAAMVAALSSSNSFVVSGALSALLHVVGNADAPDVSAMLRDAAVSRAELVESLLRAAHDGRGNAMLLRLLGILSVEPAQFADAAVAMLIDNDIDASVFASFSQTDVLREPLARGLLAALSRDRPLSPIFEALGYFPGHVRQHVPAVISAIRPSKANWQPGLRLLVATAPQDPAVIAFVRECASQDTDLPLAGMAARELRSVDSQNAGERLYQLALKAFETGSSDAWNLLRDAGRPLNELDPLIELAAIEKYLKTLVASLFFDTAFRGESVTVDSGTATSSGQQGSGGGALQALPPFAWPPPTYSERDVITDLFGERAGLTLGQVDRQLTAALRTSGYGIGGLFRIPGGFMRVSKLEQLTADRTRAPAGYRFADDGIPPQGVLDYLGRLFLAKPGVFRLILFAVTTDTLSPDQSKSLSREEAKELFLRGAGGQLPAEVQNLPLGTYECYVLVYEFEKKNGLTRQMLPSALSAREHLQRAGLLTSAGALVQ